MTDENKDPEEAQTPDPVTEEEQAKVDLMAKVEEFRQRYDGVKTEVEAGGIAFCTVYVGSLPINVTSRASNPYDAMATLLNAVSLAKKGLNVTVEKQGVVHQAASVTTTASFGPSPFDLPPASSQHDAPAQAAGSQPSAPAADGVQEFIATKFEIVPRADGKAEMKFYADGHKFPDLYSVMNTEYCIKNMAATGAWTEQHFKQVATYDVNYRVKWKNSDKLNSKGNPYKDLISVEPA